MSNSIPINDLNRYNKTILEDLEGAVRKVLSSGWYILGPEVGAFEKEFAAYCSVNHCIGVANGTDAIELALRSLGVTSGDHVATVANAGMYSTTAIRAVGANPLYIEIERDFQTMNPDALAKTIGSTTRAIIVTHLYGQMADMPRLLNVADSFDIPIIEDCAQAHGAVLNGKRAGNWGKLGCFSFYPTKNLGAIGDGGAVVTNDPDLAERVRKLRQYGWETKYKNELEGGRNSRLDELQAAILRAKLPRLDQWNADRRDIASRYNEAFASLPVLCPPSSGEEYVAHLYVLKVEQRNEFRDFLKMHHIATDIHYPIPDYLQNAYKCCQQKGALPITEEACDTVVSLPCFPGMDDAEVEQVIDAVRQYFIHGMLNDRN